MARGSRELSKVLDEASGGCFGGGIGGVAGEFWKAADWGFSALVSTSSANSETQPDCPRGCPTRPATDPPATTLDVSTVRASTPANCSRQNSSRAHPPPTVSLAPDSSGCDRPRS